MTSVREQANGTTPPHAAADSKTVEKKHLIVLQHGFWGVPQEFSYLSKLLLDKYNDAVVVVNCTVNKGFVTNAGIYHCGDRTVDYLVKTYLDKSTVGRISFIGHSMGGLINRYVIGRLQHLGVFEKVTPVNYISLATPHTGARRQGTGCYDSCINLSGRFSGIGGEQFSMLDEYYNGAPLLQVMATPSTPFYQGLERFQRRVCYANVLNDGLVTYPSASIQENDPYEGSICIVTSQEYPSIVQPCTPETDEQKSKLKQVARIKATGTCIGVVADLAISLLLLVAGLVVRIAAACRGRHGTNHDTSWLDTDTEKDPQQFMLAYVPLDARPASIAKQLKGMSWERVDVFTKGCREHTVIHARWLTGTNDVLCHLLDMFIL